jgi:hypothetical protein
MKAGENETCLLLLQGEKQKGAYCRMRKTGSASRHKNRLPGRSAAEDRTDP